MHHYDVISLLACITSKYAFPYVLTKCLKSLLALCQVTVCGHWKLWAHHLNVDTVQLVGKVEGEGDSPKVLLGEVHG